MDLMTLVAKLTLDSSEYEKGLDDADAKAGKMGKLAAAAKGVGVAAAAITTATAAAGGAFIKGAGNVAEYGDNIDKMSQKMGISAEKYQEWDAILQHSGTSIEALKPSMKTLANAAETGSDAFQKLGLSQEQVASMTQEELFEATIAGLQNVTDTTERTYLAGKLLGRGATELGALLNTSAEDTEAMRQRVHELGGVMSDEAVKASARYQDSLQDMTTAMGGVKRNIMASFLPSLADAMDGLGNLFSGNSEEGLGQIKNGVSSFIENMTEAIPRVIEFVGTITSAIGQAIIENLPTLLEAGVQGLIQIANGLAENAPVLIPAVVDAILLMVDTLLDNVDLLVDAALQLAIGIATGLINALPTIVSKIPEIVVAIITALLKALPQFLNAGVQLIHALLSGIVKTAASIPRALVNAAKKAISAVKNIDWKSLGINIIKGIARGMLGSVRLIVDAARNAARRAFDAAKSFLGIQSPSKLFRKQIGENIGKGVALGIRDSESDVVSAMDALDDALATSDFTVPAVGVAEEPTDETMIDVLNTPDGASGSRIEDLLITIIETMQSMGVTIDGKALVGQLLPDIDRGLGSISNNKSREVAYI